MKSKNYDPKKIYFLHKYFHRMIHSWEHNVKTSLTAMKDSAVEQRINPWFKQASTILCYNTKINMQKSLWRLRLNMDSSVSFNVSYKSKKMLAIINKVYTRNLHLCFLMISRPSRSFSDHFTSAATSALKPSPFKQTDSVLVSSASRLG